jgi:hypothetical protein
MTGSKELFRIISEMSNEHAPALGAGAVVAAAALASGWVGSRLGVFGAKPSPHPGPALPCP